MRKLFMAYSEAGLKAMGSLNVSMGLNENYKNLDNNEKRK